MIISVYTCTSHVHSKILTELNVSLTLMHAQSLIRAKEEEEDYEYMTFFPLRSFIHGLERVYRSCT